MPSRELERRRPFCRELSEALRRRYDFASVLATDSRGSVYAAAGAAGKSVDSSAEESMWTERGFVVRVQKAGRVAEYSFNDTAFGGTGGDGAAAAAAVAPSLDSLLEEATVRYPSLAQGPERRSWTVPVRMDPLEADPSRVFADLSKIVSSMLATSPAIVSARSRVQSVNVSKLYVSERRELDQSYVWTEGSASAVARGGADGDRQKFSFDTVSGLVGLELLDELGTLSGNVAETSLKLLDAIKVEPGEYDVILDPDAAGILAHEAFGHGVETDMFVKGRALAARYLGEEVASSKVVMYDGAQGVDQTGSYLFDDEGNFAKKTLVIDHGKLVSGFGDALSAAKLGIEPSGNGRRQAFDHKAYARMTNTYFAPGNDRFEDMVASMDRGWLLQRSHSGMEDPKNWGIQLMMLVGREIVGGQFTGRLASPVVCTGFVPDVLKAITMVSGDFHLAGSGYCGKGYKEFVKVSSGGPYVKTRMRLG